MTRLTKAEREEIRKHAEEYRLNWAIRLLEERDALEEEITRLKGERDKFREALLHIGKSFIETSEMLGPIINRMEQDSETETAE